MTPLFNSKRQTILFFKKYGLLPSKKLGQNFLIDQIALKKIINTAQLNKNDVVVEIGPGIGNLTKELAKRAKKVIGIEKDPFMIKILEESLKEVSNVEIIQGDILKIWIPNSKEFLNHRFQLLNNYKVVANLPYYITSPTIRNFLESKNKPRLMVLTLQKEVAQRICAKPPHMNLLSITVQFYAKTEIVSYLSKKSFWPQPKVDSAIIKITPSKNNFSFTPLFSEYFFKIVKAGFSNPRKKLVNNLSNMLKWKKALIENWLLKINVHPHQRAETLSVEQWIFLTAIFLKNNKNKKI